MLMFYNKDLFLIIYLTFTKTNFYLNENQKKFIGFPYL